MALATGCAPTAARTLAQAAAPSPVLFESAPKCLEHSVLVGMTPKEAGDFCLAVRKIEADRATGTANATARALVRVQDPYNGNNWQGAGWYGGNLYLTQPNFNPNGQCQGCGVVTPANNGGRAWRNH